MGKIFIFIAALLSLTYLVNAISLRHDLSPNRSRALYNAIRDRLLSKLNYISNAQTREKLRSDLEEDDDSKRVLTELDTVSAGQIFAIMKIEDPGCDANKDGVIKEKQLKCLNIIWKSYVPPDDDQEKETSDNKSV